MAADTEEFLSLARLIYVPHAKRMRVSPGSAAIDNIKGMNVCIRLSKQDVNVIFCNISFCNLKQTECVRKAIETAKSCSTTYYFLFSGSSR